MFFVVVTSEHTSQFADLLSFLLRARSVVPERAQEPFLLMMAIQINKTIPPEIHSSDHSIATEHALKGNRGYPFNQFL
jgi:hypothetical protein